MHWPWSKAVVVPTEKVVPFSVFREPSTEYLKYPNVRCCRCYTRTKPLTAIPLAVVCDDCLDYFRDAYTRQGATIQAIRRYIQEKKIMGVTVNRHMVTSQTPVVLVCENLTSKKVLALCKEFNLPEEAVRSSRRLLFAAPDILEMS
jgi:hypothetical protein